MTAQTQPSPLLECLYGTGWVLPLHLRRQPFEIDFGGRPPPNETFEFGTRDPYFYATKLTLSVPRGDSGYFDDSQQSAIRQPEECECSDCRQPTADTDLYFGFFQQRGVTRLRRADTQGDKL